MNAPTPPLRSSDRAYAVRRPRPTDAIGESLRRIYGAAQALPQDLQRLLGKLDRIT
jgi:hypothetical protein